MNIQQKSTRRKTLIICIVAVILLCVGVGAFYYINNSRSNNTNETTNYEPPTQEQIDAGSQKKQDTIQNQDENSKPSSGNTDPSAPTAAITTGVTITAATQNDDIVAIRSLIDGVQSGTCTLILTMGDTSVQKTAPTQLLANSTTCQGFNIPTSELSPGTWQITLALSGEKTGSAKGTVIVK